MPIKKGVIYCVNHKDIPMVRNSGFNAITAIEPGAGGVVFHGSRGVPIVVFSCSECGYIETYVASKTPYWEEFARGTVGVQSDVSRAFETNVLNALQASGPLFGAISVRRNIRLVEGGRTREVDAVIETKDAIYVFEVKANAEPGVVSVAAMQVWDSVQMISKMNAKRGDKRPVYPVVVVPTVGSQVYMNVNVPVLRYDAANRKFENIEAVIGRHG